MSDFLKIRLNLHDSSGNEFQMLTLVEYSTMIYYSVGGHSQKNVQYIFFNFLIFIYELIINGTRFVIKLIAKQVIILFEH